MIDAWSGPAGAPTPQEFRRQPADGFDQLLEVIRNQGTRLRESTSNLLGSAGIRLKPGRMVVEQSLDVEGDLTATGSTQIDGSLGVTGSATFSGDTEIGGNARITGTLSLPAGIIDNDALANPVGTGNGWAQAAEFGTPSSAWTELASTTITVPAGFSSLQFTAIGTVLAMNNTGSTQYLFTRICRQINGSGEVFTSIHAQSVIPSLYTATSIAPYVWTEGVTPGGTHRFWVEAWTSAAFAANSNHFARLDVAATFSR